MLGNAEKRIYIFTQRLAIVGLLFLLDEYLKKKIKK